jgi:serine/threonine-protein kinase
MAIHASDKLIEELRTHRLLSNSQLTELEALPNLPPDSRDLAKEIVKREWLTAYQVNLVYRGKGRDLLLDPYILIDKLGEGGMGEVYKARHQRLERIVALKVIKVSKLASKDAVHRFQREARAAAQLSHPNIVTLYEDGQEGDRHWFAMEFVRGVDLSRWVREKGPMPLAHACQFIRQAAQGLQHAHEKGMVHRDIKPSNLMLVGGANQIKVLDMGLARLDRGDDDKTDASALTQEGAVMGTPDFLAPEQALDAHRVDIRADIYSLGCSLYYLLAGQPPFPGGALGEKLLKHQLQKPKPLRELRPEVPAALAEVLDRAMAKKPEDRFQTPGELATALLPFSKVSAASAAQLTRPPAAPKPPASDTDTPHPSPTVVPGEVLDVELMTDLKNAAVTRAAPPAKASSVTRTAAPAKPRSLAWLGWVVGAVTGIGAVIAAVLLLVLLLHFLNADRPPEQPPVVDPPAPKQPATLDALDAKDIPADEKFSWQPKELVGVFGTHKWRHWGPIKALAFGTTGHELASFGDDDSIRICDANTGQERLALPISSANPTAAARAIVISPSGRYLAVMVDSKIAVYLTTTGREEAINLPGTAMAFAPDSKTFAVANGQAVDFYNVTDGFTRGKLTYKSNVGAAVALAFAPKDNLLAILTRFEGPAKKAEIKLWDYTKGELKGSIPLENHQSRTLLFTPDGKQCLTAAQVVEVVANKDGSKEPTWPVVAWDVAAKKELRRGMGHKGPVMSMAVTHDGQTLATGSLDGTTRVWDVQTLLGRAELPRDGPVEAVAVSADDKVLASGGRDFAVRLYDLPSARERDTTRLAYASWIKAAALSPDRTLLATLENQPDHGVRLWEAGTVKEKAWLKGHNKPVLALSFSRDNQVLATASLDKAVSFWDVAKPVEPKSLLYPQAIAAVAFAPEGRIVATGTETGIVKILDIAATPPKELANLAGHTKKVVALDWYRDGKKLVSASDDGMVRVWDVVKGKELNVVTANQGPVKAVAVSPKGKFIVSAGEDGTVKVWDPTAAKGTETPVHTWKNPLTVMGKPAPYRTVAFTTDGKTLAVGCERGSLTLYDTATWKESQTWKLPGAVHQVMFDVYGRHLVCVNGNGTAYVLRLVAK